MVRVGLHLSVRQKVAERDTKEPSLIFSSHTEAAAKGLGGDGLCHLFKDTN